MRERLVWTDLPELECGLERLADYRREAEHMRLARPAASSRGSHGRQLAARLRTVANWLDSRPAHWAAVGGAGPEVGPSTDKGAGGQPDLCCPTPVSSWSDRLA
jgi:hypothetical protein